MKNILANLMLKLGVYMHNWGYALISSASVRLNNGIHPKHEIMGYHQFFIDNVLENDTVLDVGCGNGYLAYDIAKKAKRVVGIDINKKNIKFAEKYYKRENLEFILGDATKYQFNESFDVIILSNVLEHIKNRVEFLKRLKNIAPKFLIRVPLITRSWLPVYLKELGHEYRLDKTHYIEYMEEEFFEEIEKAGLEIESYYAKWGELYAVCIIQN
jgi:2-polyprenyl-3-methyl-5-hydroxy-6-metoxy-1,4-benzoquinol methylase